MSVNYKAFLCGRVYWQVFSLCCVVLLSGSFAFGSDRLVDEKTVLQNSGLMMAVRIGNLRVFSRELDLFLRNMAPGSKRPGVLLAACANFMGGQPASALAETDSIEFCFFYNSETTEVKTVVSLDTVDPESFHRLAESRVAMVNPLPGQDITHLRRSGEGGDDFFLSIMGGTRLLFSTDIEAIRAARKLFDGRRGGLIKNSSHDLCCYINLKRYVARFDSAFELALRKLRADITDILSASSFGPSQFLARAAGLILFEIRNSSRQIMEINTRLDLDGEKCNVSCGFRLENGSIATFIRELEPMQSTLEPLLPTNVVMSDWISVNRKSERHILNFVSTIVAEAADVVADQTVRNELEGLENAYTGLSTKESISAQLLIWPEEKATSGKKAKPEPAYLFLSRLENPEKYNDLLKELQNVIEQDSSFMDILGENGVEASASIKRDVRSVANIPVTSLELDISARRENPGSLVSQKTFRLLYNLAQYKDILILTGGPAAEKAMDEAISRQLNGQSLSVLNLSSGLLRKLPGKKFFARGEICLPAFLFDSLPDLFLVENGHRNGKTVKPSELFSPQNNIYYTVGKKDAGAGLLTDTPELELNISFNYSAAARLIGILFE